MIKLYFIYNTAMWYRRSFIKELSETYNIKFIFTHMQVCREIYGVEPFEKCEWLESLNYMTLKNYFNFLKPHGIAFGIIKESMGNYDLISGGSWDSISEIIETIFVYAIAKFRRKPIILRRENWDWYKNSNKNKILKVIFKNITRSADALVVPGTKHKEYFISLGSLPEKIFIMPNACDISIKDGDHIKKEKLRDKFKIGEKKVILYVGRLVKQKGVDYLLKAFAKYKKENNDIVLVIVGNGECRNKLEILSKDLKIDDSVYFIGHIEYDNLPAYYLLCNVCVVPSITYRIADAWAFVVNEAMYFGKPVIATEAVGAAYDMIENGKNGYMIPEKDSYSIYIAMKKILSDPELEIKMGYVSKKIIEEGFMEQNMVEGFSKAVKYLQLIKEK